MSIQPQLSNLARSLRIELIEPGRPDALEPIRARVGPDLPNLQLNEILPYDIDLDAVLDPLTRVSKDVRFSDQHPEALAEDKKSFVGLGEPANVTGGIPIATPITGGFIRTDGVPAVISQLTGMVGKISGTIPILSTTSLPVALQVEWFVSDKADGSTRLVQGRDFIAPEGLAGRAASFLLLPKFASGQTAETTSRWLFAKVKLAAGAFSVPPEGEEILVPGIEVKVPTIPVAPLLAERFKVAVPVPVLAPAQPATPQLVETQVQNAFTRIQQLLPGIAVTFGYELKKDGKAPESDDVVDGAGKPFAAKGAWSAGNLLKFHLQPQIQALRDTQTPVEWTLEVKATVSGLPGTKQPLVVELPAVPLFQLPVPLPVLVAGFDERYWEGGEAIVFLHHDNPLFQGFVDRKNAGAVEQIRSTLLVPLDTAVKLLSLLSFLFPHLLGDVPVDVQLGVLRDFVQKLRERAPSDLVITAERKRDDIGNYSPGWYDRISSIFMIGAPGGPTLKLFEGKAQQSHELHLRVPDGFLAASYWTIHESAFKDTTLPYDSPPAIPDPGREQEGRSAKYPSGSFGNMPKSFRWD